MSTKTLLVSSHTGAIAAGAYTFEVVDPALYLTLCVDGMRLTTDSFVLLRANRAGTGWEPYNGVVMSPKLNSVTPTRPGIYSFSGGSESAVTFFTEEMEVAV